MPVLGTELEPLQLAPLKKEYRGERDGYGWLRRADKRRVLRRRPQDSEYDKLIEY